MNPNDPYSCGMVWESTTCRRIVIQYLDGDEWALLGVCRRASDGPNGIGSVGAFQHDKTGEWIFDQEEIRAYLKDWKHVGVWDAYEYPRTVAESDAAFARDHAELTALREKAALADDLYRIWRGHEHACRSTMYLEHWMGRYEAIK